jgi:hypothetical protein
MNQKNPNQSEAPQESPSAKRQSILEKYSSGPLDAILKNPKLTPTILLVLAVAPIIILAIVLAVILPLQ